MSKSDKEMYDLYHNAYTKSLQEIITIPEDSPLFSEKLKKNVLLGVRYVILNDRITRNSQVNYEIASLNFTLATNVVDTIGLITPRVFMQLFPVEKIYDGNKYGMKDYFSTLEYINTLDIDKPIAKQAETNMFLWDYMNWDIIYFLTAITCFMDDIRKCEGKESMMSEFCHDNGIKTYQLCTDEKGKKFIYDEEAGRTTPFKERPDYLKVKMGGKK